MQEYTAMVGLGRRSGTQWRPREQGLVEGVHQETQKVMGILIKDVMQCLLNETGVLQYVAEFVVHKKSGPTWLYAARHRSSTVSGHAVGQGAPALYGQQVRALVRICG